MPAQLLCAHCQKPATSGCARCRMVVYCNGQCQKDHWSKHKIHCKSDLLLHTWKPNWVVEARIPTFVDSGHEPSMPQNGFGGNRFLWGNLPAFDILNLKHNEGEDYAKDLNLLFAASGDLRNIITTAAQLPAACKSKLNIVINDWTFEVVARNIFMLLIIIACPDENKAVECVIHLWYSALLRKVDANVLYTYVRPLIEDVVGKIASKDDSTLQRKTWRFGSRTLSVVLYKKSWSKLLDCIEAPSGLSPEDAQRIRRAVLLAPERRDYRERQMYAQAPEFRFSQQSFAENGILLPFGHSREPFDLVNPTLFLSGNWPMNDSLCPMNGWDFKSIRQVKSGGASHDIYGKLYLHVHDLVSTFRHRVATQEIGFQFFSMDARHIPEHVKGTTFARIDVSNTSDSGYLGPHRVALLFVPLLQNPSDNAHATLITTFMNAIAEVALNLDPKALEKRDRSAFESALRFFKPFISRKTMLFTENARSSIYLLAIAKDLFRDMDGYFNEYMSKYDFHQIESFCNATMKSRNTIIEKWPWRLKLFPQDPGAQEEFEDLFGSGHTGCERYVEWQRKA